MQDDTFKFSLSDFLAYLFPGTMTLIAVALCIKAVRYKEIHLYLPQSLAEGFLLLASAYFTGVVVSSITYNVEEKSYQWLDLTSPLQEIHLTGFEEQVVRAYQQIFKDSSEWSKNHFYLVRAFVRHLMPASILIADRQNSLRQLRRNSLFPTVLFGLAGFIFGLAIIGNPFDATWKHFLSGLIVSLTSIGICLIISRYLIRAMHQNRKREIREICAALLSLSVSATLKNYSSTQAEITVPKPAT